MEDDQELGLVERDLLFEGINSEEMSAEGSGAGGSGVGACPSSGVARPEGGLLLLREEDEDCAE